MNGVFHHFSTKTPHNDQSIHLISCVILGKKYIMHNIKNLSSQDQANHLLV